MSLTLSEKLLTLGSRPQLLVLDYYVSCMTAMVELILSGHNEVEGYTLQKSLTDLRPKK